MLHFGSGAKLNSEFFRDKIEAAFSKRQSLLKTETNSYRLLFGESDGFPGLIADVYDTLAANPDLFNQSALIVTYDEHGGFFDHVPPPQDVTAPHGHSTGRRQWFRSAGGGQRASHAARSRLTGRWSRARSRADVPECGGRGGQRRDTNQR